MIARFSNTLAIRAAALSGVVVLGIGSAYVGMARFGNRPIHDNAAWSIRQGNPKDSALPYVLGYYLASGQLPPPLAVQDYHRDTDDDGGPLAGSCVVEVKSSVPDARWWTLSAVNSHNVSPDDFNTLTAGTAILEEDDTLVVRISTSPQPGNWIRPPSGGAYGIAFSVHDGADNGEVLQQLPHVRRIGC